MVSQQDWPLGIFILLHWWAICRQHAFSASVSRASGMTQAIAGTPNVVRSSAPATNLPNRIMKGKSLRLCRLDAQMTEVLLEPLNTSLGRPEWKYGGDDETRTRDLCRDRAAF